MKKLSFVDYLLLLLSLAFVAALIVFFLLDDGGGQLIEIDRPIESRQASGM